jgi:tRNA A37 threonylcarbamoyladenosine modification protein TsaB
MKWSPLRGLKVESLQKVLPRVTLLVVPIATPLLVGVYENERFIEKYSSDAKVSTALLVLVDELLKTYDVSRIIYTRGPGSYMAIKLTYIMLKTIETLRGVEVFGCSAFEVNGHKPIKAIGSLYFIKEKETIITKKFSESQPQIFELPQSLKSIAIDKSAAPEYSLDAV